VKVEWKNGTERWRWRAKIEDVQKGKDKCGKERKNKNKREELVDVVVTSFHFPAHGTYRIFQSQK